MLDCSGHHVEVEARIKGPIVRRDTVRRLMMKYNMHNGTTYKEMRTKTNSGSQSVVYRCIDEGDIVCKSKIQSYKLYNQWMSIVMSVEKDVGNRDMLVEKHFIETTKTRYSKKLYDDTLQLDITYIHDDDIYQVEIEVLYYHSQLQFRRCVDEVIAILTDSPMTISRKRYDVACEIVGGDGYYLDTPFSIYCGKYQKPVTLTNRRIQSVLDRNIYMTPKLDGVRRFIIAFNGMVYDMDPEHMHVRLLSDMSTYHDPLPVILDTELMSDTYYIFDACVVKGVYVGDENLLLRLEYAKEWSDCMQDCIQCCVKEYKMVDVSNPIVNIGTFYKICLEKYRVDGLVFTNVDQEYTRAVIKWKQHITVDMLVDHNGVVDLTKYDDVILASVDKSAMSQNPDGTLVDGPGVYELEITDVNTDGSMNLKMVRFRDDKKRPNGYKVIINNRDGFALCNVWDGLSCIFMRKYHNQVKRDLLKVCRRGQIILDIGTGQGGDLSKWKRAEKVYCVEPNKDAVLEFKQRLRETNHCPVKIISCRVSDVDTVQTKVKRVDIMTVFFSINLFTKDDLDGLERLVSIYKPKHIVGTYMDKTSMKYGDRYPCYCITPNNNGYRIQLYGTRINQDEYTFGLDSLKLDGYKLVHHGTLDKGVMSDNEMELSKMFSSFHFRL